MTDETTPTTDPERRPSVSACSGRLYRLTAIYERLEALVRGDDNLSVLRPIPGHAVAQVNSALREILRDWAREETGRAPFYTPLQYAQVTDELAQMLAIEKRRPDYSAVMNRLEAFVRSHELDTWSVRDMADRWRTLDMDPGSRAGSNR